MFISNPNLCSSFHIFMHSLIVSPLSSCSSFRELGKISYHISRFSTFTMQSILKQPLLLSEYILIVLKIQIYIFQGHYSKICGFWRTLEYNIGNIYFESSLMVLSWCVRSQTCDLGSRNKWIINEWYSKYLNLKWSQ